MDKFAAFSDAGGLVMGYYDASKTELWGYAQKYTLADNFFHAAFGGSFLNHIYLVCVCAPKYPNAPADMVVARSTPTACWPRTAPVTPDGYAVNTIQTSYQPHSAKITDAAKLLPPQEGVTIGDQLSDKGVSWALVLRRLERRASPASRTRCSSSITSPSPTSSSSGDGTDARKEHLKDETDMLAAIADGSLPAVSFWKPIGAENEHPSYANVSSGDHKVATVLKSIEQSPLWAEHRRDHHL